MLFLFTLATGCTGGKPADTATDDTGTHDTAPAGPGTLSLSFEMDEDYIPQMDEPPVGSFLGSVYAEADASSIGPNDGAVPLFDLQVDDIDLSDGGGPTAVLYTSDPLDAQIVWILGCLDSDANDCDHNDPITVPNTNKVQVVAATDTQFNVYFGMLNPQ
jgi:hypothetical protein